MSFRPFAEPTVKDKTDRAIREALEAATETVAAKGVKTLASKASTYWVLASAIAAAGAAWAILREP